jgi:tetratricopeptide (TPR) repeat protein
MSLESSSLAKKATVLRKEGSIEEALIVALAGVAADGECIESWYQVALSSEDLKKTQLALEAFEKVVELNDEFAYGWSRYGKSLQQTGRSAEALDAFEMALIWDETEQDALLGLINLYGQDGELKDKDKQFEVLKKYDETYKIRTSSNNNILGNGYLQREYYLEAINCYKRCFKENDFPYARHNTGIAYACLNEHLNALDILEENKALYPEYEPTQTNIKSYIEIIKKNTDKLTADGYSLIDKKEYYDIYINPFELLEADREDEIENFDIKKIQKLKKNLLQEIELEDGVLPWMGDMIFDKSKIISYLDDLGDEILKEYHWRIFKDKNLLSFLSKGEIDLFIDVPSTELIDIRIEVRDDDEFANWLGRYFSKQYDKILCIAIQKNKSNLINILLGGRILVADTQIDLCYEKSHQALNNSIQQFRGSEKQAEIILPSFETITALIRNAGLDQFILKLPYQFKDLQTELAKLFRDISISCNNIHDDSELSKKFLQLGKAYTLKNSSLALKIKEDENKINEIIAEEKKKESHLKFGSAESSITKDGLKYGNTLLNTKDISSVRWGVLITQGDYSKTYNFLLAAKGLGKEVIIKWDASKDIEKQQDLYQKQIDALILFILPSVIERIKTKLATGSPDQIGPCRVYEDRVQFETKGWFSKKIHILKWNQVNTELRGGMMILFEKSNPSVKVEMSLRDTDNALILHFLAKN